MLRMLQPMTSGSALGGGPSLPPADKKPGIITSQRSTVQHRLLTILFTFTILYFYGTTTYRTALHRSFQCHVGGLRRTHPRARLMEVHRLCFSTASDFGNVYTSLRSREAENAPRSRYRPFFHDQVNTHPSLSTGNC